MAAVDGVTAVIALILNLVLISQFGTFGAGLATTLVLLVQNLLVHLGLRRVLGGLALPATHRRVYAWVSGGALALAAVQLSTEPPVAVSLLLGVVVSGAVLYMNRHVLRLGETFPELRRLPLIGRSLAGGAP